MKVMQRNMKKILALLLALALLLPTVAMAELTRVS